ncbi:MAG: citrate lyase subunit alpha [Solobacterium sp.]|nr:citrate lyase subunit alpha [Solobacterium sp.]
MSKLVGSIAEAVQFAGVKDGMTISFHHHLRSGDFVLNMVMDEIAKMGIKDLTINASSIHPGHAPLAKHVKSGVVTCVETNYMSIEVGQAVSEGYMKKPMIFRTHGGRPSSLAEGKSHIDVAFIAAPTSDPMGNFTGKIGKSACGSLGYAFEDAYYADKVVVITDNLVPYPLTDFSVPENYVDYVVEVDAIGDPQGIVASTTKMTKDPVSLRIAELAAKAIDASGLLKDGFSFQTGAGGASLACAAYVRDIMKERGIKGSYALGGITGYIVDMYREGLFEAIQDVQCFDLKAVESLRDDPGHFEISSTQYASPTAKSSAASSLDAVVLGATQIDTEFNVNVHTDSRGYIIGGSGGHTDVAEEAKLTVIVAPVSRARMPVVVDKVLTVSTPGKDVDVLVTQYGIAVNPARQDLIERFTQAKLPVKTMQELKEIADKLNGVPAEIKVNKNKIVAEVLDRLDQPLDVIYAVE